MNALCKYLHKICTCWMYWSLMKACKTAKTKGLIQRMTKLLDYIYIYILYSSYNICNMICTSLQKKNKKVYACGDVIITILWIKGVYKCVWLWRAPLPIPPKRQVAHKAIYTHNTTSSFFHLSLCPLSL